MKKQILPVENLPSQTRNEVAQQPNEISQAHFYGSATSYKLIIFALFKTLQDKNPIEPNKKNVYISFSAREFCKHLDIRYDSKVREGLERAVKELGKALISIQKNGTYTVIPWFQRIDILSNDDVCLKFNQDIAEFFNFKIGYSALELLEIGELQSFYALRYYSLAKSKSGYKNGWFEYTEDELREFFDIKSKYKDRRNFIKKVIKEPIAEINEKTSISIDATAQKLDVGKYRWRFTISEPNLRQISKLDSFEKKQEKIQQNEDEKFISRHQERFDEIFAEEKAKPSLFYDNRTPDMFARTYALEQLKEEFKT